MAYIAPGAVAPAVDPVLPVVVKFSHLHDVRVETDACGHPCVVARIKPGKSFVRRARDLPFVGQPAGWDRLSWWYFPKAANADEADERGKFFWDEFVAFARGARHGRADEAQRMVRYVLDAMPSYPGGRQEAGVFLDRLAEALVAHLRVGVVENAPPGRKARPVAGGEGAR